MFGKVDSLIKLYNNKDVFNNIFSFLNRSDKKALSFASTELNRAVKSHEVGVLTRRIPADSAFKNLSFLVQEHVLKDLESALGRLSLTQFDVFITHLLNEHPSNSEKIRFIKFLLSPSILLVTKTNISFWALAMAKVILDLGYDIKRDTKGC